MPDTFGKAQLYILERAGTVETYLEYDLRYHCQSRTNYNQQLSPNATTNEACW